MGWYLYSERAVVVVVVVLIFVANQQRHRLAVVFSEKTGKILFHFACLSSLIFEQTNGCYASVSPPPPSARTVLSSLWQFLPDWTIYAENAKISHIIAPL